MNTRSFSLFARVGFGRAILAATLLFGLTHSAGLSASPNDCIEDAADGRKFCGAKQPTPYTYGLCDEGSNFAANWCLARGGQWQGEFIGCVGATPDAEDNLAQRALAYSNSLPASGGSCSIANDTGWDFVGFAPNCWNHPPLYSQGYLLITFRRFSVNCLNAPRTVEARKDAQVQQCPVGFESVSTPRGPACSRPIETCTGCTAVGNPITPASGIKILEERDYRHPAGLELVRHYHSFRFYEPFTTVNGAHSEGRFGGISWRSNFDKRVIPISGSAHVTAALTFPNGEVQYFNTAGDEVLNYGRGTAKLVTVPGTGYYYRGPGTVEFFGTDGRLRSIASASGNVLTLTYSDGTSGPNGGFAVNAAGNPTATVLPANLLIRVSDSYGRVMGFGLNAGGHIITMTDPEGGRYLYAYTPDANLATVTYPDTRVRTYRYNEPGQTAVPLGRALTSILDENGNVFAKYSYDAQGRAISSEHAGGVERYQFTYETDGTTTVVDPLGAVRSFGFQTADGVSRFSGASQAGGAGFGAGVQNRTYDSKGNVTSQTDFNGSRTCYAYDTARNLETVRVEGVPSATSCASVTGQGAVLPSGARKIVTEWHPRWRLPTRSSEPGRRTTHAYNGEGGASCAPGSAVIADGGTGVPIAVVCARTLQATDDIASGAQGFSASLQGMPRIWNYSYNALGKVLTMDGPRTDLADATSYEYHADDDPVVANRGMLKRVTNPAGHVTDITAYNAHGQPLTLVDPNQLTTTLGYDSRQRLTSRTVGGEVTSYDYDPAGQLAGVTLPGAGSLSYTYDNAHRLTEISDSLGNRIVYTLDAMANRTLEEVRDPLGALAQTRSRVFTSLNRLSQEIGAAGQTTAYGYDNQGNLTSIDGPLAGTVDVTTNAYDSLNRLFRVTDPNSGQINYGYDALDQLTSVSDPRSLVTSYSIDGLGNLNQQVSPDTGPTVNTYDAAGNLLTRTDAKGQVTSYTYDALNRVTSITYQGGVVHGYQYDQGANGNGRLTQITEPNSTTQYVYDQKGRLTSETRTINSIAYATVYGYDASGRLNSMTYPGGRQVTHTFDGLGRIQQIDTHGGSTSAMVIGSVVYQPFGPAKAFTFGNAQTYARSFDQDGRIASYTLATQTFSVGFDAASRINLISENGNPTNFNTYTHDALDRLTQAILPTITYGFGYDAVGNRLSRTAGTSSHTYAYSGTSNRLSSITPNAGPIKTYVHDANGSATADGVSTYGYDTRGRMTQAVSAIGTTNYQVNSLGQRIRKTNTQGDTIYHYDMQGRLIAESSTSGTVQKEYIYLGDIPVAVIQ